LTCRPGARCDDPHDAEGRQAVQRPSTRPAPWSPS
jgi:hypothetical protein